MLIQALCQYYDFLAREGKVLPDGYSNVKVHYLVYLTPEGEIDEISNWQLKEETVTDKGKIKEKYIPRSVKMPQRTEKPGIDANFVEHRPLYLFGLNFDKDHLTSEDRTGKAKKSHEAFVDVNLKLLEGLDSPVVNAFRKFILNWNPEKETENENLLGLGKAYATAGFVFCPTGRPDMQLHEDEGVRMKWECMRRELLATQTDETIAQCAISGEREPIARIHGKIKGVYGGLATGTVLVQYKSEAGQSYGNEQSFNSNISERMMKKYVEALNYLLDGNRHKVALDDLTVVFWAMSEKEACDDLMAALFFGESEGMSAQQTEEMLAEMMQDARDGNLVSQRVCSVEDIDPATDFYMLGLKPNSSRLSVKFLYRRAFGEILQNIAVHQNDLQVSEQLRPVPLWRIKRELISPKSKNESVDPALLTKIVESMLYGTRYPSFLLNTVVRRVKTDTDVKLNAVRAGVIKACINRADRISGKKEELNVALDKDNKNPAYLCGRLFAVLEKLQQDASGNNLNRTIRDAYFASASSKPAIVFPKLLRLAQNHQKKAKWGDYYIRMVGEIIDDLGDEFPETLLLVDQGKFMIGYYQQNQAFFVKSGNAPVEGQEED